MKKLSYKIIGVLFGIALLLSLGIFNMSYATEDVNMDNVKAVINDKLNEMDIKSIIERPQLRKWHARISIRCCKCKKRD